MKNEKLITEKNEKTALERWENEGGEILNVPAVDVVERMILTGKDPRADGRRFKKSGGRSKMFGLKISRRKIGILLLIVFNLGCGTAPKPDELKIEETKRIWQTIPIYPGMTETSESDISQNSTRDIIEPTNKTVPAESTLVITETYKSDANFADVEAFYTGRLAGWRLL